MPTRLAASGSALKAQFHRRATAGHTCDVLDAEDVERIRASRASRFGRTDMLVNNAGQGRVSTFADTTDDAWREELDLKYFSVIRPTRAFLPMLRDAAGGKTPRSSA